MCAMPIACSAKSQSDFGRPVTIPILYCHDLSAVSKMVISATFFDNCSNTFMDGNRVSNFFNPAAENEMVVAPPGYRTSTRRCRSALVEELEFLGYLIEQRERAEHLSSERPMAESSMSLTSSKEGDVPSVFL
eukprot:762462-Hanusia_phi.AAC.6